MEEFFFVFNQAVMKEDQTFRWHGVKSGDLIEIFNATMDVEIETEEGLRFKQEIWFFATVLEIKEVIQKYHGFPISRQILVFNGNVLEDEHDTEHYEILEGSRILLQLKKEPVPAQQQEQEPVTEASPEPPKGHQKQSQNKEHAV
ncbi:hypothetical protein KSP39_PZI021433 [Platanthera zijinensis]|uniref:Ubiquitin-like domain-containing protein n=1 Tax=Platanthera zijinensis TaxID=2320716 RepID=A0AAP0AX98_9ASPA